MFDFEALNRAIVRQTVLCIGDLMLDDFVYGEVTRISPEAPTPVLAVRHSEVEIGGAGNVARNIAALGATCIFVGLVGEDEAGLTLRKALGKLGEPLVELTPGLVVGIRGHRDQPLAHAVKQAVEDPPVNRVRHPARGLGLEQVTQLHVMVGEIAVDAGQDRVEQLGVVASRDDDSQRPASQWRHLDGVYRPGQFGGDHALDILIAESLGYRDDQIRGATGEAGGVGLVGADIVLL